MSLPILSILSFYQGPIFASALVAHYIPLFQDHGANPVNLPEIHRLLATALYTNY
jgi:hypothetical protein